MKTVLHIPSWYPSHRRPLSGIFTKEAIEALARHSEGRTRHVISRWGHDDTLLPARYPLSWAGILSWHLHWPKNEVACRAGELVDMRTSVLHSDWRLPLVGLSRLVGVAKRHFEAASRAYGKVDLIHAHVGYPGGYVARQVARQFGVPFLITEHMGPFPFPGFARSRIISRQLLAAVRDAATVVCVSESQAERVQEWAGVVPSVIPNLVNNEVFFPALGGSRSGPRRFLTIATLEANKGVDVLLDAIAQWRPRPSEVSFVIVGDGPCRNELLARARQLGIEGLLEWRMPMGRAELRDLITSCDALVHPSLFESFGMVVVEALMCGVPVLATRCGGPNTIVDVTNGLLVAPGDAAALANGLVAMWRDCRGFDPVRLHRDAVSQFSSWAVVARYERTYEAVLSSRKN